MEDDTIQIIKDAVANLDYSCEEKTEKIEGILKHRFSINKNCREIFVLQSDFIEDMRKAVVSHVLSLGVKALIEERDKNQQKLKEELLEALAEQRKSLDIASKWNSAGLVFGICTLICLIGYAVWEIFFT